MTEDATPGGIRGAGIRGAGGDPIVCPYLGLADDPRTHFAFATIDHVCHSGAGQKAIDMPHQGSFCLSDNYPDCRRYVDPVVAATNAATTTAAGTAAAALPVRAGLPTALLAAQVRQPRSTSGRRNAWVRPAVILVAGLLVVVVAVMLLSHPASPPGAQTGLSSPAPAADVASPAGGAKPTPTNLIRPTDAPAASPRSSPPSLPTTHIVTRGETLSVIAYRYRVTVAAIEQANGLKNPNVITVGQRLIIPAP